jgi:hypothetical protein
VFALGSDPVEHGLVVSMSGPSGNVTGVTFLNNSLSIWSRYANCAIPQSNARNTKQRAQHEVPLASVSG